MDTSQPTMADPDHAIFDNLKSSGQLFRSLFEHAIEGICLQTVGRTHGGPHLGER